MLAHRILDDEHDSHPENPERVRKVWETLMREGLVERCTRVPSRDATIEELALFHEPDMIKNVQRTVGEDLTG
jgi:acetoin utilization deacetylase AcuC-like enzyme